VKRPAGPTAAAAQAPIPSPRPTTGSTSEAAPGPQREEATSGDLEYQHLQPLLATYATTEPHDPTRERLREQLVTGYLPVTRSLARRYAGRGEPLDDLEQVGCIGLMRAIERFDPDRGYHFLAFAVPTITGEIRRHFRDRTWAMRVPRRLKELQGLINTVVAELSAQRGRAPRPSEIAAHLQISTEEVAEALHAAHAYRPNSLDGSRPGAPEGVSVADTVGAPDPRLELFTDTHSLASALAELPERERSIVIMRFYQDMTQTQIAERIGLSQMHISRILAATLSSLRKAVEADPRPPPTPHAHTRCRPHRPVA
jgi:RNA polymerase sigma-B factor